MSKYIDKPIRLAVFEMATTQHLIQLIYTEEEAIHTSMVRVSPWVEILWGRLPDEVDILSRKINVVNQAITKYRVDSNTRMEPLLKDLRELTVLWGAAKGGGIAECLDTKTNVLVDIGRPPA